MLFIITLFELQHYAYIYYVNTVYLYIIRVCLEGGLGVLVRGTIMALQVFVFIMYYNTSKSTNML